MSSRRGGLLGSRTQAAPARTVRRGHIGAPSVKVTGVAVEMAVTTCNNSVFVTADDGARDRRMQSGAMDGVTKEEGSVMGPCNSSKIVIADGGARDQRMQSDATDGAIGRRGEGGVTRTQIG